jgi:hypothetical protein
MSQYCPDDEYWLLSDQPFTIPDPKPDNLKAGKIDPILDRYVTSYIELARPPATS